MHDDQQHEGADGGVVGFTFHACASVRQPCAGALAVEIRLDPRVWIADDAVQRIDFIMRVDDHADTIAGTEDGVQIVRDHDDGELELLLQIHDQLIERRRR